MEENEKINAEVIAVLPNKVKISVDDLEDFQLAEEKLKVGSYLRDLTEQYGIERHMEGCYKLRIHTLDRLQNKGRKMIR